MNSKNGWKYIKVSELFDEVSEKNHPDADVLTIIQGVGTVLRTDSGRDILYDKNSLSNYKFVKKGDFIIHLRSFEGGLEIANQDGIVSPAYIILRPKLPTATNYLYTVFHSNRFINQTMAPAVEGVRDGRSVKYEVLKERSIPFPPLAEQQKIAQILTKQDEVISLKEKLLEQKQQQKRWLMQKLLEVPYENSECMKKISIGNVVIDKTKWKKEKLGNLCDTFSGGTPSRSHKEFFNGNIPWIKSGELNNHNIYSTEENITELGVEKSSAKIIEKGTLLIAMYGATAGVLAISHIQAAINQAVLALIPKTKIEKIYLKNSIHNKIDSFINKFTQGGQPNFSASIVESFIIYLPSLPEQKIIAQVLSAADKEIDLLKQEIELQKQKKKALAQQLLSGKARVKT